MATLPTPVLTPDSALVRGIRSMLQGALAPLLLFITGLVMAVWHVPGVPEVVINYIGAHLTQFMTSNGLLVGVIAFVWNLLRKDVPNF